uniref:Major facilitator superfamily (MFS) profile domain-containing protein n=1 Tax=Oryza meridionalis TaxID=40149 RepID=A0A0E0CUL2_9ORYZ
MADLGAWKNTRQQYSPSSPISLGSSVFSESSLELSTTTADGSTANAVLAAIVASIGNLLQGWDNAAIAGAIMYIKNEFNLQNDPMMEGLILAMSLIGATIITALSGMITNSIGKRPLLSVAAILYSISALIMFQASNEYMLLLARLIYGFGSGLVVTYAPLYISETAPTNMRGLLNTLPQINGSLGMLLSYIMVFLMSLTPNPNWRIMLGSLSIPSFVFLLLCIFCLPESPVFLVSKGKIEEAKNVMKRLRGTNEVSKTTKLYGHEEGVTWFARPFKGKNVVESDHSPIPSLLDPIVTLFDSIHDLESQEDLDTDYEDDLGHPLLFHQGSYMEGIDDACVNGGWHMAWKFVQRENEFGQTQDDFQQIFLQGDILQAGRVAHATALVSTPSFHHSIGPAMVHPSKFNLSTEGQSWSDLLQPGIKQGLIVGVTIQILQQLAGISGILYYTPQILEQAGAGILLKWFNVSSSSSSILTSGLTTFMMLPSIGIAMKCMDRYGRRSLLLYTIPMLIVPETKGMPLAVIANSLAVGAKLSVKRNENI